MIWFKEANLWFMTNIQDWISTLSFFRLIMMIDIKYKISMRSVVLCFWRIEIRNYKLDTAYISISFLIFRICLFCPSKFYSSCVVFWKMKSFFVDFSLLNLYIIKHTHWNIIHPRFLSSFYTIVKSDTCALYNAYKFWVYACVKSSTKLELLLGNNKSIRRYCFRCDYSNWLFSFDVLKYHTYIILTRYSGGHH